MNEPKDSVPLPSETRTRPLHQAVEARARELWESYGRPQGQDEKIWLEAERQLLGADRRVADQGSGSVSAPALRQATRGSNPPTRRRSQR